MNPLVAADAAVFGIAFAIATATLALIIAMLNNWAKKQRAAVKAGAPSTAFECIKCDCTATMKCPQGRDPANGDPYRCRVWVQSKGS